jgi:hypothetical protein
MPHRVDPKVNGAAGARICFDGSETIILDRRPALPNPANGLGGGAVNSIRIILSKRLKPGREGTVAGASLSRMRYVPTSCPGEEAAGS